MHFCEPIFLVTPHRLYVSILGLLTYANFLNDFRFAFASLESWFRKIFKYLRYVITIKSSTEFNNFSVSRVSSLLALVATPHYSFKSERSRHWVNSYDEVVWNTAEFVRDLRVNNYMKNSNIIIKHGLGGTVKRFPASTIFLENLVLKTYAHPVGNVTQLVVTYY